MASWQLGDSNVSWQTDFVNRQFTQLDDIERKIDRLREGQQELEHLVRWVGVAVTVVGLMVFAIGFR